MNDEMSDLVDDLVVASLKLSYENNKSSGYNSELDHKLLSAIETVLEYYMTSFEFLEWARDNSVVTEE